jgi:hypothetical protein
MDSQRPLRPSLDYSSPTGCLLRLFWILFGPLTLTAFAGLMFERAAFSLWDLAFWTTVAALLCARYLDITHFAGRTAEGTPATLIHLQRFALYLILGASVAWIIVHLPHLVFNR